MIHTAFVPVSRPTKVETTRNSSFQFTVNQHRIQPPRWTYKASPRRSLYITVLFQQRCRSSTRIRVLTVAFPDHITNIPHITHGSNSTQGCLSKPPPRRLAPRLPRSPSTTPLRMGLLLARAQGEPSQAHSRRHRCQPRLVFGSPLPRPLSLPIPIPPPTVLPNRGQLNLDDDEGGRTEGSQTQTQGCG